ncbi:MAG: amidohydrolase family protein [Acidimicrobiales bacterium]|nr:amidohydrolase family protein [Acidimicrobiales bacterium]
MQRTVIRGGFIVTRDPALGNLPSGDVLIEDGVIAAVGRDLGVADAEVIDATDRIVMPGFVDAHRHIWQGAMRSLTGDGSLFDYVAFVRMHRARFFTPEDMYAAQLHGALEALDAGVTSVTDYCHNLLSPDHAYESIRGVRESGMRVVWNYGFNFPPQRDPGFGSLAERIDLLHRLASEEFASSDSKVTLGVAPEELGLAGDLDRLSAQFAACREVGARAFWHANPTPSGGSPREVATLADIGALDSNVTFVHMFATEADEWRMIADAGAAAAFSPETEFQMGMFWPSVAVCTELGIPFGIGTDITSNNSADMFTALRLGLQGLRIHELEKAGTEDLYPGTPISCDDALAWGTTLGAETIGLGDRVGSLTPGKQADVVLLRGDSLGMAAWDRSAPERSILLQASRADVDTVMVGGDIVKRSGEMVADVARACRLVEEAAERVAARAAADHDGELPLDEVLARVGAVAGSEDGAYVR